VAFNAAHRPAHAPPPSLNPRGVLQTAPEVERFGAVIEALDIELGRVVAAIDWSDTVLLFVGDNGSYGPFMPTSWQPANGKGSVYESGTRVPLIIAGTGTGEPGRRVETLTHSVDLFPTILDIAGILPESVTVSTVGHWEAVAGGSEAPWLGKQTSPILPVIDGAPLRPQLETRQAEPTRKYVFLERFLDVGPPPYYEDLQAVRGPRYKLVRNNDDEGFYDLAGRHDDGPDLLQRELEPTEQNELQHLRAVLDGHLRTLVYEP